MKKKTSFAGGLLALLLLGSCEKIDDYFNKESLVVNGCQIASINTPWIDDDGFATMTKGTFSYNTLGQPISILFQRWCGTGSRSSRYLFRYDAQHRLTDFIAACENDFADEWHVFKYNNKELIVQDSTYIWVFMEGNSHPSETAEFRHSTIFTYDVTDRMTRAIHYFEEPDEEGNTTIYTDTANYTYNNDGNLVRPGANYDDKINICRTNKIWMFLNRDYSRNNYMPALSYTGKGLPLAFPVSYANFPFSYTESDTGTVKFEYNCNDHS